MNILRRLIAPALIIVVVFAAARWPAFGIVLGAVVFGILVGALGLAAFLAWYGWRQYKRVQAKQALDELMQSVENARRVRVSVETHRKAAN